jgi:hypothetical protein
MTNAAMPTGQEIAAAKTPHDIFLSNLIMNHILLFTGFAAFGGKYIFLLVLVPIISLCCLAYTFYRAKTVLREDSEFVYIHWQIAWKWSRLFLMVLGLLISVSVLGFLAQHYLDFKRELVYGLVGGVGMLPTLVATLILVIIESDSLHHARSGTFPNWVVRRFKPRD